MSLFWSKEGLRFEEMAEFNGYFKDIPFDFHPTLESFVKLVSSFFSKPLCWLSKQQSSAHEEPMIDAGVRMMMLESQFTQMASPSI
jgi:hypothetical protein